MWAPAIVLVIVFHMLDRKNELAARTDFLWRAKLKVEQEEVETMRGINKILLENILPAHVAEHFLREQALQVSEKKKNYLKFNFSCLDFRTYIMNVTVA